MDIERVLTKGSKIADESEIYISKREVITLRLADKRIIEAKGNNDHVLAIRLIKDKRIGSIITSRFDNIEEHIDNIKILGDKHEEWQGLPYKQKIKPFNGYDLTFDNLDINDYISIAKDVLDKAFENNIDNLSGSLHIVKENIRLVNTNGLDLNDKGSYIIISINVDKDSASGIGFNASRSLRLFKPEMALKDAIFMAISSTNPIKVNEDKYSIIFEPYAFGELLSFVFAYNFNSKLYREKRSALYNMLGEKVAIDNFTLYDDPRLDNGLGSKPFDDEGIETKENILIDNGVFKGIAYDLLNGYKDSKYSTSNGIRLGYPIGRIADLPSPGIHNMIVKEGDYDNLEIIKDTKKGIIIGRLWYTYPVNPERGDFSCTGRSGIFLVENGDIKVPSKPVRIIDNIKHVMQNISAISIEKKQVLQWHSIPCITPMIRVDDIRVIPV